MNKKSILILFYIFTLGFVMNCIYPVFPILFEKRNYADIWFGIFGAGYSLTCAIFGLVFAKLSNRFGNKLFLSNLIFFGLSIIFFLFKSSPQLILLSRIISGIFISGALVISNIILINLNSNNKKLIFAISLSTGIFGFGNATGFFVGGLLGDIHYLLPFYLSIIGSISIGILAMILFEEEKVIRESKKIKISKEITISLILFFFVIISFSIIAAMIPFLMHKIYQVNSYGIGLFMFSYGVAGLIINFKINPLFKRKTPVNICIIISVIIGVASLLLYYIFNDKLLFYFIFISIFLCAISLARPPLSNIIINKIGDNVMAMSLSNFTMYLATLVGNLISSVTYQINFEITILISSIFLIIAMIFLVVNQKKLVDK